MTKLPTKKRIKKEVHRIPYDMWRDTQLSVARFYGGININGKEYLLDYDNCRTTGEGENKKFFPDLVCYTLTK